MGRTLRTRNGSKLLADAVADWRAAETGGETLGGPARDRILHSVADGRSARLERVVGSLFLPFGRLVLAGAAPVMLVAVLLGWVVLPRGVDPAAPAEQAAVAVHVSKQGGDVVFVLENGGRAHQVTRSTSPENGGESIVVVRGSFRDDLTGGADLVFYRID